MAQGHIIIGLGLNLISIVSKLEKKPHKHLPLIHILL